MKRKDTDPQSFSDVIREADHGRIDVILSRDLAELTEYLTDKASLHEDIWKGEITIKIKLAAEPNGKLELGFARTVKRQEEKMPRARMQYDPDTKEITNGSQIKISGTLDARPVKSASAPESK